MTNYLGNLIARHFNEVETLQPRLPSRFEPQSTFLHSELSGLGPVEDDEAAEAFSDYLSAGLEVVQATEIKPISLLPGTSPPSVENLESERLAQTTINDVSGPTTISKIPNPPVVSDLLNAQIINKAPGLTRINAIPNPPVPTEGLNSPVEQNIALLPSTTVSTPKNETPSRTIEPAITAPIERQPPENVISPQATSPATVPLSKSYPDHQSPAQKLQRKLSADKSSDGEDRNSRAEVKREPPAKPKPAAVGKTSSARARAAAVNQERFEEIVSGPTNRVNRAAPQKAVALTISVDGKATTEVDEPSFEPSPALLASTHRIIEPQADASPPKRSPAQIPVQLVSIRDAEPDSPPLERKRNDSVTTRKPPEVLAGPPEPEQVRPKRPLESHVVSPHRLEPFYPTIAKFEKPERADPSPTINISIGRIEVRATPASSPSPPKARREQVLSLDEYLKQRASGGAL